MISLCSNHFFYSPIKRVRIWWHIFVDKSLAGLCDTIDDRFKVGFIELVYFLPVYIHNFPKFYKFYIMIDFINVLFHIFLKCFVLPLHVSKKRFLLV